MLMHRAFKYPAGTGNPLKRVGRGGALVQFGVNTTTETRLVYQWWRLYKDFCRDSLVRFNELSVADAGLNRRSAPIHTLARQLVGYDGTRPSPTN